jgi:hypothetical protein
MPEFDKHDIGACGFLWREHWENRKHDDEAEITANSPS